MGSSGTSETSETNRSRTTMLAAQSGGSHWSGVSSHSSESSWTGRTNHSNRSTESFHWKKRDRKWNMITSRMNTNFHTQWLLCSRFNSIQLQFISIQFNSIQFRHFNSDSNWFELTPSQHSCCTYSTFWAFNPITSKIQRSITWTMFNSIQIHKFNWCNHRLKSTTRVDLLWYISDIVTRVVFVGAVDCPPSMVKKKINFPSIFPPFSSIFSFCQFSPHIISPTAFHPKYHTGSHGAREPQYQPLT